MFCHVFFVSDGTGITAEGLGLSLMSQFEHVDFDPITLSYLDTPDQANAALEKINALAKEKPTIIFATLVREDIRQILKKSRALYVDFLNTFLGPLESYLGEKSSYTIGRAHSMHNPKLYQARIDAINYSLNTDDGANFHQYRQAEVILVGASRCGKTPTCLYLALQYGVKAANYPITEEDLQQRDLPKALHPFKSKLFGLTIDIERLRHIRSERRPDSEYASYDVCQREIKAIESLFHEHHIPFLNTTRLSIEEMATKILSTCKIQRHLR